MTQQIEPRYLTNEVVRPIAVQGGWSEAGNPARDRPFDPVTSPPTSPPTPATSSPPTSPPRPTRGHSPYDMATAATSAPLPSLRPAPGPPLNGVAVASVVCAFLVAPVGIVLGLLARRQIARRGGRGRGLATLGTLLGSLFTVTGIASVVTVIVMTSLAVMPGSPAGPVPAAAPAPSAAADQQAAGRASLLLAYGRLSTAAETFASNLGLHRGDTDAQQQDCAGYEASVQSFRTTVAGMAFSPQDQARVNGELLPATDVLVSDLNTMATTASSSTLSSTAGEFDRHTTEFDQVLRSILSR